MKNRRKQLEVVVKSVVVRMPNYVMVTSGNSISMVRAGEVLIDIKDKVAVTKGEPR